MDYIGNINCHPQKHAFCIWHIAFCIWHITTKFSGWFTAILCSQYSNWYTDFYKLYKLESCEEFEHQWSQVMAKYDMFTNKHVSGLYQIKHFFGIMLPL